MQLLRTRDLSDANRSHFDPRSEIIKEKKKENNHSTTRFDLFAGAQRRGVVRLLRRCDGKEKNIHCKDA